MLVQEVVDEIIEKLPNNTLSVQSILRKITVVRDNLIRNFGGSQQQSEAVVSTMDLLDGQSQYPLPCPPGNVVEVEVKGLYSTPPNDCWNRIPVRQFNEADYGPYYYFLSGTIGLVPSPCADVTQGLKIFHTPVLAPLGTGDLNGATGFDPNYDMVLVYGVLRESTMGAESEQYDIKYKQWERDYKVANSSYAHFVIKEGW